MGPNFRDLEKGLLSEEDRPAADKNESAAGAHFEKQMIAEPFYLLKYFCLEVDLGKDFFLLLTSDGKFCI